MIKKVILLMMLVITLDWCNMYYKKISNSKVVSIIKSNWVKKQVKKNANDLIEDCKKGKLIIHNKFLKDETIDCEYKYNDNDLKEFANMQDDYKESENNR